MASLEFSPTASQSQPNLVTSACIRLVTIRMIRWPRSIRSLSQRGQSFPTQSISHTHPSFYSPLIIPFDYAAPCLQIASLSGATVHLLYGRQFNSHWSIKCCSRWRCLGNAAPGSSASPWEMGIALIFTGLFSMLTA